MNDGNKLDAKEIAKKISWFVIAFFAYLGYIAEIRKYIETNYGIWVMGVIDGVILTFTTLVIVFYISSFFSPRQDISPKSKTRIKSRKEENYIIMRENVYGPIFTELSNILDNIKKGENPIMVNGNIEKVIKHYLFQTIETDLRVKIQTLITKIESYQQLHLATELMFQDKINDEIKKMFGIEVQNADVWVRTTIGRTIHDSISLIQMLFRNVHFEELLEKKTQERKTPMTLEFLIQGKDIPSSDFRNLYENVIVEVGKNSLYVDERKERESLIKEIEMISKEIRKFINIS